MIVYCVDDTPIHLEKIKQVVNNAFGNRPALQVTGFCDARQMLKQASSQPPALATLDINMPGLDGLSTLVKLKTLCPACTVVMVSAENKKVVRRLASNQQLGADETKKRALLSRVVSRVRDGIDDPGKINSVLEACATLGMDPVEIAKEYGARAFLGKPFDVERASQQLTRVL